MFRDSYLDEIAEKDQEIERLRTALKEAVEMAEFYSYHWRSDIYLGPDNDMLADFGKRARAFLEKWGGRNERRRPTEGEGNL